jgi:mRNA-degrading endonuclease RelE of RelBE toxin-antitoxin system
MENDERSIEVVQSDKFIKEFKRLGKRYNSVRKDIQSLIDLLRAGETPGDRITGNKYPVYKVRVNNSDARRGKSGGYRVIYYIQIPEAILLTNIYSKSDRANISNEEIEEVIDRYMLEFDRQKKK